MFAGYSPGPYQSNPGGPLNQFDLGAPNSAGPAPGGFLNQPLAFWVGAAILLIVLKVAGEHEGSKINPAHYHVGGYNLATFLTAWIVGWGALKLAVTRWFPSSGAAQFVSFL